MDRAKWIKAGLEIAEHLKAIRRIIEQNGMDRLSMASFSHDRTWGTYIDDNNDKKHWTVEVDEKGVVSLEESGFKFYTKM